jgi:hypothetical protein
MPNRNKYTLQKSNSRAKSWGDGANYDSHVPAMRDCACGGGLALGDRLSAISFQPSALRDKADR